MKQRILPFVLALTLLFGLAASAESSRAATVYFTAANDTLLELSDATMPFWEKGLLHVSASAFGSGGLGISDSYNVAKKTLTLKRSGFRLICNLSSGMTVDSTGTLYEFQAVEKNGVVFLPINEVCRIFGLSCTTRSVANGYLVRIRNENASFTDDAFLSAAAAMIGSRYQDYMASHRQESTDPLPEDADGRALYLALTPRSAEDAHSWLTVCDGTVHHITFFLTEEFLSTPGHADAVRRMLAEGHNLGLAVSGSGENSLLEQLRSGNAHLAELACVKTRLVYTDSTAAEALIDAGYCPVTFDLSCAEKSDLSSTEIYQLLNKADSSDRLDLGSTLSATALRSFLRSAYSEGFTGQNLRESAH